MNEFNMSDFEKEAFAYMFENRNFNGKKND